MSSPVLSAPSYRWHLGHCNRAYLPTSRGFDTQFGFYNSHISNMYKTYSSYPFPYDFHKNDQPLFDRKYGFQNQGVRRGC